MTITTSSAVEAPLFVVVGSTGTQGRSVIDAIAADDKVYRVRGITRDPSKTSAQELKKLGVDIVAGDVDDASSIVKAFEGAEIVFAMTTSDYWSPNGREKVCWWAWCTCLMLKIIRLVPCGHTSHTAGTESRQDAC